MRRIKLVVAYDGTAYCGFQVQNNGPTIEGELNKVLSELFGEDIRVIGASRTDSGVHAYCNVAVFDTEARMPAEKMIYAINQRLPEDIRVQSSCEVAATFHPRHTDSRKTYEYRIYNSGVQNPMKRHYALWDYHTLDINKMKEAAAYLVGEHDFKSFCSTDTQVESTVRTIYRLTVEKNGEDIVISVCGNGFLYNMVRIIAGTLLEVGKGKIEPISMVKILNALDRQAAGPTAPAHGLTLVKYEFLEDGLL